MRRKTDPSNPDGMPWQRWLPHAVVFVRDRQGRVCALRTLEDGAPVELVLGAVIVRAAPGVPGPGLVEWSVHASVSRHSREAKAALAIIHYTQVAMQAWQKRLKTEREGGGAPAPRKAPEYPCEGRWTSSGSWSPRSCWSTRCRTRSLPSSTTRRFSCGFGPRPTSTAGSTCPSRGAEHTAHPTFEHRFHSCHARARN